MKKLFFLITVVFFSLSAFSYENFRVHKTVIADMTDEVSPIKAVLEVNDALVIKVPTEPVFLQGLSLEVKIPPEVAEFRDSVAYFLYTDVKPQPTEKTIDLPQCDRPCLHEAAARRKIPGGFAAQIPERLQYTGRCSVF